MPRVRGPSFTSFSHGDKLTKTARIVSCVILMATACLIAVGTSSFFYRIPDEHSVLSTLLKIGWALPILAGSFVCLMLFGIAVTSNTRRYASRLSASNSAEQLQRIQYVRAETIAKFGSYEIRISLSSPHEIGSWSDEMFRMLGRDPVKPTLTTLQYLNTYVVEEDRMRLSDLLDETIRHGTCLSTEYRIRCDDGTIKHVFDYLEFVCDDQQQRLFFGQRHDITERKSFETERLESAAHYQNFVEQLGGTQYIAILEAPGSDIYIGNKISALLGFTQEEWCSQPGLRARQIHEDDRAAVQNAVEHHAETNSPLSIEYRIRGRDGKLRWIHDEARIVTDISGNRLFRQGVMFDVTDRKQAQEDLERSHHELKKLIGAIDASREEEQRRLAREMHDDLGQLLAAMKLDLDDLQQYLPQNDARVTQRMHGIHDLVTNMVVSVRRIIADLPPKMLEDLGLSHALSEMAKNFKQRHKIACTVQLPSTETAFDQRISTAIYRMVQEALNNVARHSGATHVRIRLEASVGNVIVTVSDNGTGMAVDSPRKAESFGLMGIQERVAALRGKLEIKSAPDEGTRIRIALPVEMLGTFLKVNPNSCASTKSTALHQSISR